MSTNKVDKPTEDEIISALSGFKPLPGDRFYRKMRSAPWSKERSKTSLFPNFTGLFIRPRWKPVAVLFMMILLIAFLVIAAPSARVVAQNILKYFAPANSDNIAVQITDTIPIALGTSVPAGNFSLDIAQVETISGFPLKEISQPTGGLSFSGAYHDPTLEAVALRYDGEGFTLIFSQRHAGEIKEYASIGATAPVEPILINGIPGEYVEGGWRVEGGETNNRPTVVPDGNFTLGIYWDPELPQRIIRWGEGQMIYEILALGRGNLSKDGLIIIAESVK